jgi:hypothetical protein
MAAPLRSVEIDYETTVEDLESVARRPTRPDVAIALAWGLESVHAFHEPWATRFPDPTAALAYVDIFHRGSWVHRDAYVIVDGDRCYLPLPLNPDDLRVAPGYAMLIRLIGELSGGIETTPATSATPGFGSPTCRGRNGNGGGTAASGLLGPKG